MKDLHARLLAGIAGVGEFQLEAFGSLDLDNVKEKGSARDIVTWVDVTAWGKTAENVVKYLQKGSGCIVVGRLTRDEWKAQDGSKRTKLKVTASFVRFFPKSANAGGGERPQAQAQPEARPAQDPAPDDDYNLADIPF